MKGMSGLSSLVLGPPKRRSLGLTDKREILRRQHGKCARCHKRLLLVDAQFDHKVAKGLGGSDNLRNYQALHANCHQRKTKQDVRKMSRRKPANPFGLPKLKTPSMEDFGF